MLIEKAVWDLVKTGSKPEDQKTKKNHMTIGSATEIIKKSIGNDIFNNIINFSNLKELWEKLYSTYSQVGQKIVQSILHEFLIS